MNTIVKYQGSMMSPFEFLVFSRRHHTGVHCIGCLVSTVTVNPE